MESIKSMKFSGVNKYAGGAQAMRPYPRIYWEILGLANSKNFYGINKRHANTAPKSHQNQRWYGRV
jgi:hypothetical protein